MSKSTNRYGKVTFQARTSIDANPTVPEHIRKQWAKLDTITNLLFGCDYFDLTEKVRTKVHEILNGVDGYQDERVTLAKAKLI